jgi:subtilisin family serine protease
MRQPLTATIAACSFVVCLSCGSDAPSQDDVSIVNADREARAVEGIHGAARARRSHGDAEEGPRWVPGRLVVKFRDTLDEPADVIHRHGLEFSASARSGGSDLDRLNAQYRVSSITPVFSSLFARASSVPGKGALADRRRKVVESVNESKARFAARAARAGPRAEIPDLVHIYVLEVPAETDIAKMAADFSANPSVEYAVPDHVARTQALPDDPYLGSYGSWGQPYGDLWALATIGAPAAWELSTGVGTVVAVVDTGLDYDHPDIVGNVWANQAELHGAPGMDDDGNGYVDDVRGWDFAYGDPDPMDRQGHGTHVSGTIAAVGNNGIGVIGVAYQARIMGVKGLDDGGYGPFSGLASAITYAARNGADVISNSWGCYGKSCTDAAVADAVRLARSLGCVITFAAGNNGDDVKHAFPANLQDVITVAASGADDSKASFSNWGYLVDVAAPGGGPEAASPFAAYRNILSLRAAGTGDANLIVGGSYLRQAGTSMATPHVSGVVALVLAANPQLTVAQVESIIRHTARDEVGDPSLDAAGYDPYYGWGRLDAAAAVARAFDPPADPPILKMVAEPLEFDVPATMCPGQQWSLPVAVYNLGGGTMSWSAFAPDWLSVQTSSATTPSFASVSMNSLEAATGLLTIRSPEASNGHAGLQVTARVASGIAISNCSTVLTQAHDNQHRDPIHNISTGQPGAPDGAGGAFYVWTDTRMGNPDLFMQRVDRFGNPLWNTDGMALTSARPGAEVRPTIVSDGAGGAIIAWVEGANTGDVYDKHIRAQRVSASGQKLWGADGVWVCQATGGQERPTLISKGGGSAIVAWLDYRYGSADIYAQRIDATGTVVWQTDGLPVARATNDQFDVAMATDGSGGAILTWVDTRTAYFAVYAQRMNAIGQPLWTQNGLRLSPENSTTPGVPGIATGPNIISDGAGGAIIAWHDFRDFPFTAGANLLSRSDIYAVRLNREGLSLWPAGGVPLMSGLTASPAAFVPGWAPGQVTMTSDGRGGAFVVWHDARNVASWDVYTQRVDPDGNRLWGTNGVPVTKAPGDQLSPSVAMDGEDGAVYAWSDERAGHQDVFVQRLGPTGAPLAPANGVWIEGKPGDQSYPFVVPLAEGKFLVTWDDLSNCGSTGCAGTGIDILGKVVDFGGGSAFPLAVTRTGYGTGTVTSSPVGIDCGTACSADFAPGTSVTLTAQAASGSFFSGWSGPCTGTAPTCAVTMDEARMVEASFSLVSYPLTVEVWGSGKGTVTGDGISCLFPWTPGCKASFPNTSPPATVTLTATPDAASVFAGWSGCTTVSGNVCTVSMDAVKTVKATFDAKALLTVWTSGTGRGTVTGGGISCTTGSTAGCTVTVPVTWPVTNLTLTAMPDAASVFAGWSGCTTVSGNVCTVSMTAAKTVTATFHPTSWLLTAQTAGAGRGTVTGGSISCTTGSTVGCTTSVPNTTPPTSVTLTAAPDAASLFMSWTGCTSVSGTVCTVSMAGARSVTATFQPKTYPLTLNATGGGGGTAFSESGGFTCMVISGVPCTGTFANGETVVLTASADTSSVFKSWLGCTSVSGATCTIKMTAAKTLTLRLEPSIYPLMVNVAGGGAVEGDGIACATGSTGDCTEPVANGGSVTLTATPNGATIFKSWLGCTSVSGTSCTVSMTAAKSVTATFQPSTYPLTTVISGSGTVTGPGIACATGSTGDCTEPFANGGSVTLTATPAGGAIFKSWSGCSSVSGASCTVSMISAKSVTATFQPSTYPLTTVISGSGTVTGPGIACTTGSTGDCTEPVANGGSVTLTATPDGGAIFKSWSGCSSVSGASCTVSMISAKSVTATFQPSTYQLTTVVSGSGTVTGPGIACTTGSTGDCTEPVANGGSVTLTATPDGGAIFKSWLGCTSVSGASCTVTVTSAKSVTATFQPSTYQLTTVVSGSGTVTGPGIACTTGSTGDCTEPVANGGSVTLTATPDGGAIFKSWLGCTSVSGASCTVTVTSAKSVTATFQPSTYPLTTVISGSGTVTGPGIACTTGSTGDCTEAFANGGSVTLTATPAGGAIFKSWLGCSSVSGASCTVSMTSAKSVTATFQPSTYQLTTVVSGSGTVTGPGIACTTGSTGDCTEPFANGGSVTLTATPDGGAIFKSWLGCSSVSGASCTVSMTAAKSVTATFQPSTYPLTTVISGSGTVTGPGIACTTGSTGDCTEAFANGGSVTLTATPAGGAIFKSWLGCSSVSGASCTVSMTAAKSVTATFQPSTYPLTTVVSGSGTVTGIGITCTTGSTGDCTEPVANGGSLTLVAAPGDASIFKSWLGCTSVSGTSCTVSMTGAKSVTATFQPATWLLTAKTFGAGRGTVTGGGISCTSGSTEGCTASVANTSPATSVTLTAAPELGSIFSSWMGCSSVSGPNCTVSVSAARTVTATFGVAPPM